MVYTCRTTILRVAQARDRVAEILRVVVAEGTAVVVLFKTYLPVIWDLFGGQPAVLIGIRVCPDGVHVALLLHDVQDLLGAFVLPAEGWHLDGNVWLFGVFFLWGAGGG